MTNGDLSYGDGGWYLWNNPAGPAEVQTKIGEMGLGVDASEGAKVVVTKLPKDWWGLQLQPPKWLAPDTGYYTLTFKAKGNMPGPRGLPAGERAYFVGTHPQPWPRNGKSHRRELPQGFAGTLRPPFLALHQCTSLNHQHGQH